MKTSSAVLVVLSVLALNGCILTESQNDIGGHLLVKKNFAIVDKDGTSTTLEAGKEYDTVLHMAAQGSDLAVHPNPLSSIDTLFPEPTADSLGKVSVAGSASKQGFDLTGEIAQSSSSYEESGSETCLLGYRHEVICHQVYDEPRPGDHGHGGNGGHSHTVCEERTTPIYGQQSYHGTRHITDRSASLNLTDPASKEVLASFNGSYRMANYLDNKVLTSGCMR